MSRHDIIETLVHVSARVCPIGDLQYVKQVQNIASWETGRRIMIYPPPQIPPGLINISERQMTPEPLKEHCTNSLLASPSQIPDSQPTTPFKPYAADLLNMSPSPSPIVGAASPLTQVSPEKPSPATFQTARRPPRAVSLKPVNLSPLNTPAQADGFISLDHMANEISPFTSTPKSKPLKRLLSDRERPEISSPRSKVNSNNSPLIPPDLATLFPLSLFRCKSQSRELVDWECGFWKVNMSLWPESEKLDFWKRMRKAIESGRFGWMYVLFDTDEEDVLKINCFGGACKHIWVFLYVMSSKRTKYGLQFLDSSDKVVIECSTSASS